MMSFVQKNLRTIIDVIPHTTVHIYIKPHNCLNYNGMPQIMRKPSIIINMWFKQCKIFKILWSESHVYRNWQTWAIIREISYSNLKTGIYGQNLEFPGLSRRVHSAAPQSRLDYGCLSLASRIIYYWLCLLI